MKWDYLDWVSLILNCHVKVNSNTNCFLSPQITVVLSRVRNDSYMSLQRTKACVHAKSLQLCPTHCNPMDYSPLGSFIHGKRQEYWNGLLHPPPGDLLDPGIKPASLMSPALASGFFIPSTTWEAPQFFTTCWPPPLAPYFEVSLWSCSQQGPTFPQTGRFKNRENVYVWESTEDWQHSLL